MYLLNPFDTFGLWGGCPRGKKREKCKGKKFSSMLVWRTSERRLAKFEQLEMEDRSDGAVNTSGRTSVKHETSLSFQVRRLPKFTCQHLQSTFLVMFMHRKHPLDQFVLQVIAIIYWKLTELPWPKQMNEQNPVATMPSCLRQDYKFASSSGWSIASSRQTAGLESMSWIVMFGLMVSPLSILECFWPPQPRSQWSICTKWTKR